MNLSLGTFVRNKRKTNIVNCNASSDRIDSDKDYTEDNVQWVYKIVNIMKQALDQTHFINMCKLVSEYKGVKYVPT